ncbi:MAG: hypothetical protein MK116_09180 [Phycisphaerales bacterium]|nr:hypothetical protein [Phycisphaerales bacterium]
MDTTGGRPGRLRPITLLSIILLVLLIALAGGTWLLASWSPGWFDLPPREDADTAALGEHVEFRLAEELQRIRASNESWRIRMTDEAINAWLAARLLPWMSHEPDLVWPERLSRPQVRFSTSGIDVGIRVSGLLGSDRVVSLRFEPVLDSGRLLLKPGGIRIGRLPVPFARSAVDALLRESLPRFDDAMGELVATALGEATMEAIIPLVDERRVLVDSMQLERGAIVLEARTLNRGE